MTSRKWYVVWAGNRTGVFDSWEECRLAVEGFPGARYKGFASQNEAISAYRGNPEEYMRVFRGMARQKAEVVNYDAFPEIDKNSIAVDAACSRNPGPVEYQGVDVQTGTRLFHVGPLQGGSNNLGEFLAIVHALAWLQQRGLGNVTIYSDSRTAISWIRKRAVATKIPHTAQNAEIFALVARAENWLRSHTFTNRLLKWETEKWGEIPADFGRK